MVKEKKIANAFKRSEVHRKAKRDKEQEKLKRRMDIRKAEQGEGGEELKKVCLCLPFPLLPPSQQWRTAWSKYELTSSNDLPRMFQSHSIIAESTILRVTSLPTQLLGERQLNEPLKLLEPSTVR
jgi:ribosome production factor 1